MAYLFDTDAISELLKPKPAVAYVEWLRAIPREDQYTSAVCVRELYYGAYRSDVRDRHVTNIENRILPATTVLPFDIAVARLFGRVRAALEREGRRLADADLQIASTAMHHGLELVTGNTRHIQRIPGLTLNSALTDARRNR